MRTPPARKSRAAARELGRVVRHVLEHVDVENRVEAGLGGEALDRPRPGLAAGWERAGGDRRLEARRHLAIGLETEPRALAAVAEMTGRRAEPGADLEDVALEVGPEKRSEIVPSSAPRGRRARAPGRRTAPRPVGRSGVRCVSPAR